MKDCTLCKNRRSTTSLSLKIELKTKFFFSSGCQIKTTTSRDRGAVKLYHADQDFTKKKQKKEFGVLVSQVETSCFFFRLCFLFLSLLFLLRKTFWSANVQYELENKRWWWEIVVVVVVCRRWTLVIHVSFFSRVVWTDGPAWVTDSRATSRLLAHPQLPISAHLQCDIGFFFVTLSLSLHGILYPRPPSDQIVGSGGGG